MEGKSNDLVTGYSQSKGPAKKMLRAKIAALGMAAAAPFIFSASKLYGMGSSGSCTGEYRSPAAIEETVSRDSGDSSYSSGNSVPDMPAVSVNLAAKAKGEFRSQLEQLVGRILDYGKLVKERDPSSDTYSDLYNVIALDVDGPNYKARFELERIDDLKEDLRMGSPGRYSHLFFGNRARDISDNLRLTIELKDGLTVTIEDYAVDGSIQKARLSEKGQLVERFIGVDIDMPHYKDAYRTIVRETLEGYPLRKQEKIRQQLRAIS